MKLVKNGIGVFMVLAIVVGFKLYKMNAASNEVKASLVEICVGDEQCTAAVEVHFDACFDDNYDMGGRRRSASLDAIGLATCINEKAGVPMFGVAD